MRYNLNFYKNNLKFMQNPDDIDLTETLGTVKEGFFSRG